MKKKKERHFSNKSDYYDDYDEEEPLPRFVNLTIKTKLSKQTDRQTDRLTDRKIDKQTDMPEEKKHRIRGQVEGRKPVTLNID